MGPHAHVATIWADQADFGQDLHLLGQLRPTWLPPACPSPRMHTGCQKSSGQRWEAGQAAGCLAEVPRPELGSNSFSLVNTEILVSAWYRIFQVQIIIKTNKQNPLSISWKRKMSCNAYYYKRTMLQIKHISLSLCPLPCLLLLCVCVGRESISAVCVTRKSTFQFDFMTLLAKHQHEKTK